MSRAGVPLPARGAWRRRLIDRIASPAFQAWASAFWVTRPFARRASRRLFDLCGGFVHTQVLLAVLELGVLEALADEPLAEVTLAARLGLPADNASRLLNAAAALGLLRRRHDGRWDLGADGIPLVGREDFRVLVEHNRLLYDDLRDPVALLRAGRERTTALGQFWEYAVRPDPAGVSADTAASYSRVMAATQPQVAAEALQVYDVRRHRVLLDVGGGEGVFLREAARRAPDLALHLFDLPAVAERGRVALATAGLATRATVSGGSFLDDPLPTGADLISLVRVLHDHDDVPVRLLLDKVHAALPSGGRVLVIEPMAATPGLAQVGEVYFALYLLAMRSGRMRTPAELGDLLRDAGFVDVRQHRVRSPIRTGVLSATRR
ncbi:MAG TPA: methyltransferase [Gemmatimonadales bacterium]|nr:methyltransferase domain-containing protein [Gemmatimonadales bacterium]MCB9517803.1 methyltransferase domain-containing protein [Gemmatimonadales bacterium]HRX18868.1 methyltransferase [Gemmatimonadales bacterium]